MTDAIPSEELFPFNSTTPTPDDDGLPGETLDLVAVLSGGQDSSTALAWAKNLKGLVDVTAAIHFQYGQAHAVERGCARHWADRYDIPLKVMNVPSLEGAGLSALTGSPGEADALSDSHPSLEDVPASFVPGRNLVMFTLAAAFAMKVGADGILSGVCQRDYSGYPDCREETLRPLQQSIQQGMEFPGFRIVAPLLNRTKAETWHLAYRAKVIQEVIKNTHTCYQGDRDTFHEWGFGCGECPACEIRRDGFREFIEESTTDFAKQYRASA